MVKIMHWSKKFQMRDQNNVLSRICCSHVCCCILLGQFVYLSVLFLFFYVVSLVVAAQVFMFFGSAECGVGQGHSCFWLDVFFCRILQAIGAHANCVHLLIKYHLLVGVSCYNVDLKIII